MEQDRMSCLMIRCDLLFLLADDTAFLFCADSNLDKRLFNIFLYNIGSVLLCCYNGSFIQKVFQICAGKACCCLGDLLQIHILRKGLVFGMYLQNVLSSPYIRPVDADLTVKSSRTENSGIQYIHAVGSRHHNDSFIHSKSVHLYQNRNQPCSNHMCL